MLSQELGSKLLKEAEKQFFSAKGSTLTFDITINQTLIRVYVASERLHDWIYPAFAWQAHTSNHKPDVEIFALEGDGEIDSRWRFSDITAGNKISGSETRNVFTTYDQQHGVLTVYDKSSRRGLFWTQSANTLPEWEFGAPLRNVLTWALNDFGLHVIHAAGIGINGLGILLSGSGGAGKSTTTSICVQNGFSTTGDDYCAVSLGSSPRIFGIYGFLKLIPGAIGTEKFSNVPMFRKRSDDKVHFDISRQMVSSLTLKSIVFSKVSQNAQLSGALPSKEVLLRLLASTLSQSLYPPKELLRDFSSIATTIGAFELTLGNDVEQIREIVRTLCSG